MMMIKRIAEQFRTRNWTSLASELVIVIVGI
jgi:hypothetical protein